MSVKEDILSSVPYPPTSVKQAVWSTFFRPYFLHLFFDLTKIK